MTTYTQNGAYVLEKLTLEHAQGVLDLKPMFASIHLYESIHEPGMSGSINILDTFNLTEIVPLYGNEKISIRFYTSGNENNIIEYTGKLYKISPRGRDNEHTSMFTLFFCSEYVLTSMRSYVQRSFNDTISNIVNKIKTDYLKSDKNLVVIPTKGKYNFTFGTTSPLDAIASCMGKAVSTSEEHSYVFFENNKELVFAPIEYLYSQSPYTSYGYRNWGIYKETDKRYEEQFETIQGFESIEQNSMMDRLRQGVHGSRHTRFDLRSKQFIDSDDNVYNKGEWFNPIKSLGRVSDKQPIDRGDDITILSYSSDEVDVLNHKAYIQNRMRLIESDTFRAYVTIIGDSALQVGQCINIKLPNWNQHQKDIGTLFDGKVLIKRLAHTLSRTSYVQSLLISKDSYEEESL